MLLFSGTIFCLNNKAQAQQTPQELGNIMLHAFQTGSVDSIARVQMNYDDVLAFAHETGLDKDSARLASFKKSYPLMVEKYRSHYQQIIDQGMEQKADWHNVTLDSVTTEEEKVNMGELQSITLMSVFFHAKGKAYHLQSDIYKRDGKWKLGSNIDLFNDSIEK
jgi:hypothetical protein